jgi:hypothetical protein
MGSTNFYSKCHAAHMLNPGHQDTMFKSSGYFTRESPREEVGLVLRGGSNSNNA